MEGGVMERREFLKKIGQVTEIKLYPIELGWKDPRHYRGVPGLAGMKEGEEIITRLGKLSEPYKTNLSFRDGIGYVDL